MKEKRSFIGTVRISAEIAKKHALLKKLEMSDLKGVFFKLGEYAYKNNIGRDSFTERFAAIDELDAEVSQKRQHDSLGETATLGDKAKHAAIAAKDRASVEAMLLRRKGLIAELGSALLENEIHDETVKQIQTEASRIKSEIATIQEELSDLDKQVTGIAKRPFLAGVLGVICLILTFLVFSGVKAGCSYSSQINRAARDADKVASRFNKDSLAVQKKMAAIEMQMRAEQLQESERIKLERAKSELQEKQRQLEMQRELAQREQDRIAKERQRQLEMQQERELREKERIAKEEQRQRELQQEQERLEQERITKEQQRQLEIQREQAQREEERRAEELRIQEEAAANERQRQLEEQTRRQQERAKRIQDQSERASLALERFSKISLEPNFYPSKTINNQGAQIEVRGKNWDQIKSLHATNSWLELINILLDVKLTEYPEADQIEEAADKLLNYQLFILCRTRLREDGNNRFILLTLGPGYNDYDVVGVSTKWKAHPNGIGYTHPWSPSYGGGIILYGEYWRQFRSQIDRINATYRRGKDGLDERVKLGEITPAMRAERFAELVKRAHAAAVAWAIQQ
ncbi:MAG TPA: hypothetical protein P5169_00465 [Kiritimatiellia bacterium]|jgi:actin-related protein|nr:hypothetical protein [Kiritimatiellia bacterium]